MRLLRARRVCAAATAVAATALVQPASAAANHWSVVASPNVTGATKNVLGGVGCAGSSECWAVGYFDMSETGPSRNLIERWDGRSWSIVSAPDVSATTNDSLGGTACSSAGHCVAVGSSLSGNVSQPEVLDWTGTSWTLVPQAPLGSQSGLDAVTCPSASSCFAVGYVDSAPLVEHWNGSVWSEMTVPAPAASTVLSGIACPSATDCWAVGSAGFASVAERYNGSAWSIVNTANPQPVDALRSVACTTKSACLSVGAARLGINANAPGVTLAETWGGASRQAANSANGPGFLSALDGVSCTPAAQCWAVGQSWPPGSTSLLEGWDGQQWSLAQTPISGAALSGITCSTGSCWAVGLGGSGAQTLIESDPTGS